MGKHWVIYALGGGAGHAVRGAHLSAALADLGVASTVLCAAHAARWARGVASRVVALGPEPPEAARGSAAAPCAAVAPCAAGVPRRDVALERAALRREVEQVLDETQADVLLVDTFPNGILSELTPLPRVARRVLMTRLRRVDPAFTAGRAAFDLVLDLEPNLGWLTGQAVACGPVARALASAAGPGIAAAAPSADVLIVASEPSQRSALARFRGRLGDLRTEWVAPGEGLLASYPARLVIGPCGYNLCYELAAAGIWHVAVPAKRRYDDQRARAERLGLNVLGPEALERRVRALLQAGERAKLPILSHAQLAAELVSRVG